MHLYHESSGLFTGEVEAALPAYVLSQRRTCYRVIPYATGGFQLERVRWLTHETYEVTQLPEVFDTEADAERKVRAMQDDAPQEPVKAKRGRPRTRERSE